MFMKNINYLKGQAKNLYRDFQLEYMQDGDEYVWTTRFFDINATDKDLFYVNVTPKWSQIRVAVPGCKWPVSYVAVVRNIGNMQSL